MYLYDQKPLTYLITKGDLTAENFRQKSTETLRLIEKAVRAEISLIQIREKLLSAGLFYKLTAEAANLTKNSRTRLLVNDRADIALAAAAAGVHLTARSIPAKVVRANFGTEFIIGVSAHSLDEVEAARRAGADFATFGPVFATPSKARYGAPQGIAKLREVAQTVENFPVIALGGIDETNFEEVLRTRAAGIAAIRFLSEAENLTEIVKRIRNYQND